MSTESAVTVIEQSPDAVVEWNLDNWPVEQFNRLVPTQTLGLPTDLIRPLISVVQLDIARDTYESNDLPQGHRAPNARGLAAIAAAAGVDFPDEQRMDDGSDPMRASAKAWATVVDGAGRLRTVVGSRDYVLTSQPMTEPQRNRAKGYVYEHALTRARHRALRVLLGVRQSYPVAELQKPFAIARYVPNTQHPEIRELYKQAMVPAIAATFGPAKQLSAGPAEIDLDADEAKNVTPAPSTPTILPGEKLAAVAPADDTPSWAQPAASAAAPGPKPLTELLGDSAASSELTGAIKPAQEKALQKITGGLDWTTETLPVIVAAFGEPAARSLSAGQAAAIITVANSFDTPDDFVTAWKAAAAQVAA